MPVDGIPQPGTDCPHDFSEKIMTNNTDKTIPYRPSAADLENLRRLRRRTHPALSIQDNLEEEKTSGQFDTEASTPNHPIQQSEKNIP
jgi:hypothetical protein